jgi:hypothetical protein
MYYIFAAFNGAALIHMALLAPETKGYTLEEMDDVFNSGIPACECLGPGFRGGEGGELGMCSVLTTLDNREKVQEGEPFGGAGETD